MSEIRQALEDRARHANHGVISRADAIAAGLAVSQIDRRVRRRQWLPSGFRGRLILADAWPDPLAHLTSAVQGLNGVAWRRSGLALHGVVGHPSKPEILTRGQSRSGAARVGRYDPTVWRVVIRSGLRCLALEDAVASMAGVSHPDRFDDLVDSVLRDERTSWPRLATAFKRVRRQGRSGSALLGRVLDERPGEGVVPLSGWSRKFVRALDDAGLPRPEMEWRILRDGYLVAQVDLAYPDLRYAIELDSIAFHLNREAFEDDRRRDAELAAVGWLVRRFTWKQFDQRFPWVIQVIRNDMATRTASTPPETLSA